MMREYFKVSSIRRSKTKATLNDVALQAGVSKGIASMALNDKGRMSQDTRERVKDAARELNYHPSVRAQRLASGTSKIIALASGLPPTVIANVDHYSSEINLAGRLAPLLLEQGYSVIILPPMAAADSLNRLDLDGSVISYPKDDDDFIEELVSRSIPAVTIGKVDAPADIPYIEWGYAGVNILVDHLMEQGARDILLVVTSEPYAMSKATRRYLDAAADGASFTLVEAPATSSEDEIRELIAGMICRGKTFDGICATIDVFALGAMRAVQDAGLKIPSEVMVATIFNGTRAQTASPAITSTTHNGAEEGLAENVSTLLLSQLTGTEIKSLPAPELGLIVRASTRRSLTVTNET